MAKRRASMKASGSGSGSCCGSGGTCNWCWGLQVLILGVLVLLNHYWAGLDWWLFWGAILVICGLLKLVWPKGCQH